MFLEEEHAGFENVTWGPLSPPYKAYNDIITYFSGE